MVHKAEDQHVHTVGHIYMYIDLCACIVYDIYVAEEHGQVYDG